MKNNFAKNLRLIRNVKGITLDELANKSSVNAKTLNKYEMGATEANVSILIQIANALNVGLDYLCSSELEIKIEERF